ARARSRADRAACSVPRRRIRWVSCSVRYLPSCANAVGARGIGLIGLPGRDLTLRHGGSPGLRSLRQLALAGKAADVHDQGHAAVAEDGRAGDARHSTVVLFQVLYHDLLLANQLLDLQRQLLAVAL